MKRLLPILLLALLSAAASGQNPEIKRTWHWYFGDDETFSNCFPEDKSAGLDFSSGSAVPDTNGTVNSLEACFTMSDTAGNLLFYGQPDTIYTKNHTPMQNGRINNPPNPTQMVCVPQPGNDSLYYIFYSTAAVGFGFQYAIVNMNLAGGLGAVIAKDIVLIGGLWPTEKVAATLHCNGQDIWVFSKERNSGDLKVWLLTVSGLNPVPVISAIATVPFENGDGYFKFTPDGSMAAAAYINGGSCNDTIELYLFDNCTGLFSSPVTLPFQGTYGLSFSPDNTKLYAGTMGGCYWAWPIPADTGRLIQYDLSVYSQSAIENSATVIAAGPAKYYFALQTGPDGKIYVTDGDTNGVGTSCLESYALGVISSPNSTGLACSYAPESLYLDGRVHVAGLPGFMGSYFNATGVEEYVEVFNSVKLFPNPVKDELTISGNFAFPAKMELYDMMGRAVGSWQLAVGKNKVDVRGLARGLYAITIQSNKNTFSKKIIIQH